VKIKIREVGDVAIFDLSGKIMGGEDSGKYKKAILDAIEKNYKKILVNFSKVSWINSTGLGIIVSGYTTASEKNCDMRLMNLTDKVNSIFMITKLSTVFKTYDSEEEALANLK